MTLATARSGALTKLIQIQCYTPDEQDSQGQPVKNWRLRARAWAAVESVDTMERFESAREVGHKLRIFTIRFRNDVLFQDRIVFEEEYYDIRSLRSMERRGRDRFIEILGELIQGANG